MGLIARWKTVVTAASILPPRACSPQVWSPNLEAALQNRYVRLFIQCNNQDALEEGYLLFKIGASDESCQDHPGLCVGEGLGDDDDDENGACDHAFGLGWALVVVSSAVVAVLTVHESL